MNTECPHISAAGLQPDARAYKSHTSIAKSSKDALSLVSNGVPVTLQDLLAFVVRPLLL
jgi:hypothetical protein